jgi:Carboxypeptidase regulatory-like domain
MVYPLLPSFARVGLLTAVSELLFLPVPLRRHKREDRDREEKSRMSSRLLCSHTRTLSTQCPLWTLIALLLLCAASVAQVQTGTITGTVRDKTGAVIPNAHVTIKSLDTGATRDTVSNGQGGYTVPGLPPGNYELNVAAGSFSNFKQTTAVTVGGIATVDATLGLAEASTTVEVTAQQKPCR